MNMGIMNMGILNMRNVVLFSISVLAIIHPPEPIPQTTFLTLQSQAIFREEHL